MNSYTAVSGQSLYDVSLITYGTVDSIVKLAMDAGVTDLNAGNLGGTVFEYENALVVNQILHQQLNSKYGTLHLFPGPDRFFDPKFFDFLFFE